MTPLFERTVSTPVGPLRLVANDEALLGAYWPGQAIPSGLLPGTHQAVLAQAERDLAEYFGGQRTKFEVPLRAAGTPFQQAVWRALATIPWGKTRSYTEIAVQVGHPRAVRAVGATNARNPLSIFVPCHRVIGASGALTGYAGGLDAKKWLLRHESCLDQFSGDVTLR